MELIFTDQYTNILFLINGLAIVLYLAAKKKKRQRAMKFGNYETLQKVAGKNFLKSSNLILLTRLAAFTFLIIGLSQPIIVEEKLNPESDYVLATAASSNMLTSDIEPNRFEAAKQIKRDFISELGNDTAVGIVTFSGEVRQHQEITTNHGEARASIEHMEIHDTAGTAIGDAISMSVSMLAEEPTPNTVILIADGRNTGGIDVGEATAMAASQNVTIHTVGMGSENSTVQENFDTIEGQNATQALYPDLNTTQLSNIAEETGGEFVLASNENELEERFIALEESEVRNDISRYFILLAALIMLFEWVIGNTKYSVLP